MKRVMFFVFILFMIGGSAAGGETADAYLKRAESLYEQGDYEASGESYEKAFAMKQASALQYYNAACSWSLAGKGAIDWMAVNKRDEERRQRTLEMMEVGDLTAPDDFVHAAFIFQHGADSTSYRIAHDLAMKAVGLDSTYIRARWIAAAAKDRYLQSLGRPQIYGTQAKLIDGIWTLEPIDTTAVTDAERARWGVPPLARQRAWAEELNDDTDLGEGSDH